MGIKTGKPRGRPPGAKNKITLVRREEAEKAARAILKSVKGVFDGDSHALLMSIYKNPEVSIELRMDAAKTAIRYETPALASVEMGNKDGQAFVIELVRFTDKNSGK